MAEPIIPSEVRPHVEEAERINISDYYVVAQEPALDVNPLSGVAPGTDREMPLHLAPLPEKSILQVETKVGPRFFAAEDLKPITKVRAEKMVPSKNPYFVRMVVPAEATKLQEQGFKVINQADLASKKQ